MWGPMTWEVLLVRWLCVVLMMLGACASEEAREDDTSDVAADTIGEVRIDADGSGAPEISPDATAPDAIDIAPDAIDIAADETDIAADATDIAADATDIAADETDIAADATDIANDASEDVSADSEADEHTPDEIEPDTGDIASSDDVPPDTVVPDTTPSEVADDATAGETRHDTEPPDIVADTTELDVPRDTTSASDIVEPNEVADTTDTEVVVITCNPGTYRDGSACAPCSPVASCTGGVTCTSASISTCDACAAGFYLSGGRCVPRARRSPVARAA